MNRDVIDRMKADIRLLTLMAVNPTMHELARIPGFDGLDDLFLKDRGVALLVWPWCSPVAITAMTELIDANEIVYVAAVPEIYFVSCGPVPDLPVLQRLADSSKPHWVPVFLRAKDIRRPDNLCKNISKSWLLARVAIH
jgi:hypothetical protein